MKARDWLYITLPQQSQVIVINTITRKIVATVMIGEKTKPMRIAIQPDGQTVWVGLDDSAKVAAIDAATNSVVASSEVVKGADQVIFTRSYAYIHGTETEKFALIDIDDAKKGKLAPTTIQAGQIRCADAH